jgi:hypothetical protein
MKFLLSICTAILFCTSLYAADQNYPLLAQLQQPTKPIDMRNAPARVMGLYEQGWDEGTKVGTSNAGRIGWFFAGFGNVPFLWLPWTVEPRRPAKPPIEAAEEFNSGYKMGYRAGWKNAHKTWYIAGAIVETAVVGGLVIANNTK